MAKDDSYEIMPYKEIVSLKKQIEELQKRTGDTSSRELINSMATLSKSMDNMLQLFSTAAEEMKLEESSEARLTEKIEPLMEKIDEIIDQNRTIAEGLVAIADIVRGKDSDFKVHKPEPKAPPIQPAPDVPNFNQGHIPPMGHDVPPMGHDVPPMGRDFPPMGHDGLDEPIPPVMPPMDQGMPPPMPPGQGQLPPLNPMSPPAGLPPRKKKRGLFGR